MEDDLKKKNGRRPQKKEKKEDDLIFFLKNLNKHLKKNGRWSTKKTKISTSKKMEDDLKKKLKIMMT